MLSVEEATQRVLAHPYRSQPTTVPLAQALGRTLATAVVADRDFPPYHRVTMDGIAIRYADYAAGRRSFEVVGVVAAGQAPPALPEAAGLCLEIMTGAVLPPGADTIIRYEDLALQSGQATIQPDAKVRAGQNIHRQAEDRRAGEVVIAAGSRLGPPEVGVAATVGQAQLAVYDLPRALVVSTGDELVDVGHTPLPHQIRTSNGHQLSALLQGWGLASDRLHLPDDHQAIVQQLGAVIDRYGLILLSGGVSAGKFDYLPEALAELGVTRIFHKVAQRPGKPFWFGVRPDGAGVFALPGNPVSTLVCALRYVQPWLRAAQGLPPLPPQFARLATEVVFEPDLTYFLQVQLQWQPDGVLLASPLPGHGSGDLANLVGAQAVLELPRGRQVYGAGESFRVWAW